MAGAVVSMGLKIPECSEPESPWQLETAGDGSGHRSGSPVMLHGAILAENLELVCGLGSFKVVHTGTTLAEQLKLKQAWPRWSWGAPGWDHPGGMAGAEMGTG